MLQRACLRASSGSRTGASQTKTITLTLSPGDIGFYTNTPGQFVVEPGTVDVYVGDSSVGGLQGQFTVTG